MHINTLPEAIQRERENLLRSTLQHLETMGYTEFSVRDLQGHPEPPALIIPVLNAPMQPDILATQASGQMLAAVVEVSTDLGEESCGRRWQAFIAWANAQQAEFIIVVHQDELNRAEAIAQHWHVEAGRLVPLAG